MMLVGVVAVLAGVIASTPNEETGEMCNYTHGADQDYWLQFKEHSLPDGLDYDEYMEPETSAASNTFVELNGSDVPALEQNSPNPFNEQTIIKYYIPSYAKKANMTITDMKGSPLKSVNLKEKGLGTVTINANELPVGTYIYTLYVDDRQVESKQMILVK